MPLSQRSPEPVKPVRLNREMGKLKVCVLSSLLRIPLAVPPDLMDNPLLLPIVKPPPPANESNLKPIEVALPPPISIVCWMVPLSGKMVPRLALGVPALQLPAVPHAVLEVLIHVVSAAKRFAVAKLNKAKAAHMAFRGGETLSMLGYQVI